MLFVVFETRLLGAEALVLDLVVGIALLLAVVGFAEVVCGLDGVLVRGVVRGLGLDRGILGVVGLVVVGLDVPFDIVVCAFLVALAALSLLVLVGLGLIVLGRGDGLGKGVVLIDSGVLGVVGVRVLPAIAGLKLVVGLAGADVGIAVCGLDIGVLVTA